MLTHKTNPAPKHHVPRVAGALLAAGALGFVAVFSVLAARVGYPEMLDRPAGDVLPALIAGGAGLRAVWAAYAILPMTVVLAAWLAHPALPLVPRARRLVSAAGLLAGVAMSVGLARWSTLQWALGEAWVATADTTTRAALASRFDAFNLWLGNVTGEFLGELFLSVWFAGVGFALRRRWVGRFTMFLSALLLIGAFRNVIPATRLATEVTNTLLPAVMVWLGLAWMLRGVRLRRSPLVVGTLGLLALARPAAAAEDRELLVNGFRSPSMGIELRDGWLGFHLGLYPTIVDDAADGARRTTWFAKTGLTAYFLRFDAGSGRMSSPFVSVSLLQGLNNSWDVSKDASAGTAVSTEVGFRWAAGRHLDLRLGVALINSFDGRRQVNPTPGVSWSIPL